MRRGPQLRHRRRHLLLDVQVQLDLLQLLDCLIHRALQQHAVHHSQTAEGVGVLQRLAAASWRQSGGGDGGGSQPSAWGLAAMRHCLGISTEQQESSLLQSALASMPSGIPVLPIASQCVAHPLHFAILQGRLQAAHGVSLVTHRLLGGQVCGLERFCRHWSTGEGLPVV